MMVMKQITPRVELRLHHDRDPNVGAHPGLASLKCGRRYPDDGIRMLVEFNRLADNVWVRCQVCLPEPVTDHRYRRPARLLVISGKKSAPQKWANAKYIKIIGGSEHTEDAFGFCFAGQADRREIAGGDAGKTLLALAD